MRNLPEIFVVITFLGQCDGSSSSSSSPTQRGFSCEDYQIMMDVETTLAQECSTDAECTQVLTGSGCGCESDDLIASSGFDTTYLYELWDEAEGEGCSLDFGTSCDCDAQAEPACVGGRCSWE